jgi:opacity protein-like surface antigen
MRGHRIGVNAGLRSLCVLVLAVLGGAGISAPAHGQFVDSSKFLLLDAGWASVEGKDTGNRIDGHGARITFEQSDWGGSFGGGGTLLYMRADDTTADGVNLNYSNFMFGVLGKWYFGPRRVRFNIMTSFGVQLGSLERSGEVDDGEGGTETRTVNDDDSGFALSIGGGAYAFLTDALFLSAAYDFSLMGNTFYQDGTMHFLRIGVGFQYD